MASGGGTPLRDVDHLLPEWPLWRLILERVATLEELERVYSLDDVADLSDALDAWREAEAHRPEKG